MTDFRPHRYQQYAIDRIIRDPALGLFLDCGLGKTAITLTAIKQLKYEYWAVRKVLVIAPKKVAESTWDKEAAKWSHLSCLRLVHVLGSVGQRTAALAQTADVYLINRENVQWLVGYYGHSWPFDLLLPLYRRLSMKTEELTALGLNEDQVKQVFALNGKDVEAAKAAKDKTIADLTAERDGLKTRLDTAETTLKKFEGIDPQQIQQEIQTYKTQAEDAEKKFAREITQRDQKDWITKKLDEYGVTSPFARTALVSECMSPDAGLTWKDGAFFGFDDFMKAAKQKDAGLYQTAEEKEAAEKAAKQKEKAPAFTGPTGDPGTGSEKYTPPKIF